MIAESLLIGLVLGFLFYEIVGVSPGGVIAPGYLALYVREPDRIAVTVLLALGVWIILEFLSRHLIIYGRRRLLIAVLLGFCFTLLAERVLHPVPVLNLSLDSIGYLIPGLIANEAVRQGPVPTVAALAVVTASVYLLLFLLPL